jgi:hypothetical protein
MGGPVPSDAVEHGRHAEHKARRDKRYYRCNRCGFVCHLDRDVRLPYGSRAGQGITHPEIVAYDGGPDATPVEYDGLDSEGRRVSYDGYRSDFTITGGCPLCGSFLYDKEEAS